MRVDILNMELLIPGNSAQKKNWQVIHFIEDKPKVVKSKTVTSIDQPIDYRRDNSYLHYLLDKQFLADLLQNSSTYPQSRLVPPNDQDTSDERQVNKYELASRLVTSAYKLGVRIPRRVTAEASIFFSGLKDKTTVVWKSSLINNIARTSLIAIHPVPESDSNPTASKPDQIFILYGNSATRR